MLSERGHEVRERLREIVGDGAIVDGATVDRPGSAALEAWLTVRPADTAQVQRIVALANETGTPLVPVSSGEPHLHGGSTPSVLGAVEVDLRRMDRVLRVDRRNRLALIEPGVTFEQLIPALAAEGLRIAMPLLPRRGKSVLASLLEREPPLVPRWHWNPMEPLRSLEVVWGDGERLYTGGGVFRGEDDADWAAGKVPVVGGGPSQVDFFRLVSGAQGSMGIVTWASVKCEVVSDARALLFIAAARVADLVEPARRMLWSRFGDELFLANAACLALLLARDPGERERLADALPDWCLVVGIGGGSILGEEKVAARETDIRDIAAAAGLEVLASVAGCSAGRMLELLQGPSDEPCWRSTPWTGTRDVFFLAPLERAPGFVAAMEAVSADLGAPVGRIATYLQPIHQGVGCHCEFILPFDRADDRQEEAVDGLFASASAALFREGAYFSRPYGPWAAMVYGADPATASVTRTVKGIFDPRNVMNPGKLCFPGGT